MFGGTWKWLTFKWYLLTFHHDLYLQKTKTKTLDLIFLFFFGIELSFGRKKPSFFPWCGNVLVPLLIFYFMIPVSHDHGSSGCLSFSLSMDCVIEMILFNDWQKWATKMQPCQYGIVDRVVDSNFPTGSFCFLHPTPNKKEKRKEITMVASGWPHVFFWLITLFPNPWWSICLTCKAHGYDSIHITP